MASVSELPLKFMSDKTAEIVALLRPTVATLGLELLGVEYVPAAGYAMLRLYIDLDAATRERIAAEAAEGDAPEPTVTIEHCEAVSREVSAVLDVNDPITSQYTLEVSSPGIDRPLFAAQQYARFVGEQVKLVLALPVDGRRRFQGRIDAIEDDTVVVTLEDSRQIRVPLENVDKARLVPDFVALGLAAAPKPLKPGKASPRGGARKAPKRKKR